MGEEAISPSAQQGIKNEPSGSGVSRRRITFRPYSIPQLVAISMQPSTSSTNSEGEQTATNLMPTSNLGKTTRKWGIWGNLEINAFYDGIKQFGKDFDQVAKLMAKKKMNKDKDQIRNYYYNSFKLLRSTAQFEDEVINEFPRDARELFIVINGFEWKKRTEDMKIDPAKLRQLVLEGSTSVRLKKKKQNLIVRTPFCPSLQKFFPSRKTEERLPSHVVIWLTPKTEADRNYVETCSQNPLLRIRISVGDRISRIFALLKAKWVSSITKQEIFRQENLYEVTENFNLVLYPDKTTKVGSVFLKYYKDSPSSLFSLNRLKKERNWPCAEDCDELSNQEDPFISDNSLKTLEKNSESTVGNSRILLADNNAFGLSAVRLRSGLTEKDVGDSTVTELFYLCGMEPDIRLQYYTSCVKRNAVEPWNIFISLINRNYGENLCKILSEPEEAETSHAFTMIVEGTRKRRASTSQSENAKSSLVVSEKQNTFTETPCTAETVTIVHDHVVESENNAFKLQFESMQNSRKRGRSLVQRSSSLLTQSTQPSHIGSFVTSTRPATSAVPGPDCYFVSSQDLSEARQKNSGHFIDFSSIALNKSQDQLLETINYCQDSTPNTRLSNEVFISANLQNHDGLPINASFSQFESSAVMERGSSENVHFSRASDSSSSQKTLTELSSVDFCGNLSHIDLTPIKTTSNLPEDVRHSFEMMMQQNSVDYCRNFEQLITSIETPKKLS